MQSDLLRAFLITTQEVDFSQLCSFCRFPKATIVYHLEPKIQIDGPFFFKICSTGLFQNTLGMLD